MIEVVSATAECTCREEGEHYLEVLRGGKIMGAVELLHKGRHPWTGKIEAGGWFVYIFGEPPQSQGPFSRRTAIRAAMSIVQDLP